MRQFKPFETSSKWELRDPDTGRLHTGRTRAELVSSVTNYRYQNKLEPIESLNLVIDCYLCGLLCNDGKCTDQPLKRGLVQYLRGGLALVKKLYYGDDAMVTQEVADSRGAICINCLCNEFPNRDNFVVWSDELALHSIGDRKSVHHEALGNCMACTCCLRAKVFFKGPFNLSEEEKEKMKSANPSCWQLLEK